MQGRRNAGKEWCRKRGMQETRDSGKEGFKKGGIIKGGIHEVKDAGKKVYG